MSSATQTRNPMAAAIYCRISQDKTGAGLGVDRQREDCGALAKRLGWTVSKTYEDNDISAYSGKPRPAYRQMMADIERGMVDAVIAWHPDRLHRSTVELESFIALVEGADIPIQTVNGGTYDLSTSSGRMSARIVGAVAREKSEHASEQIRRQREQHAESGAAPPNGRSFGYTDGRTKIIPKEAEVIQDVAERALRGESLRSLAFEINATGILTTKGNPFSVVTLRRILLSDYICGMRRLQRKSSKRATTKETVVLVEGQWAPILSIETVRKLRELLRDPTRDVAHAGGKGKNGRSLLTGVIRCGTCGQAMYAGRSRGKHRYVCVRVPSTSGCGKMSIDGASIEEDVESRVLALVDEQRLAERLSEASQPVAGETNLGRIEGLIAAVDADLARDDITYQMWKSASARLHGRLSTAQTAAVAQAHIAAKAHLAADLLAKVGSYQDLTTDQKRAFLQSVVDKVTVNRRDRTPGRVPAYDDTRVVVETKF